MDLETIQEMKKELELALINLNEGASDENTLLTWGCKCAW